MSSISGLNSALSVDQTSAAKPAASTQPATSANDTFAAMFAQMMATLSPAQNAGTTAPSSTSTQGATSVSSDLSTLSQALASGNLSAAQLAFQSLQSDLQNTQASGATQGHHHHHHHGAAQNAAATGTTAVTGAPAATSSQTDSTSTSQLLSLLMGQA